MSDTSLPFAIGRSATTEQTASAEPPTTQQDDTSDPSKKSSPTDSVADRNARKRKSHKKSRHGCENCKIRRVKCDEARPRCQKCMNYGVDCSYDARTTGLKFAGESSFVIEKPIRAPTSSALVLGSMAGFGSPASSICSGDVDTTLRPFKWLPSDLEVLGRFQNHTVLTVGTKSTAKLYQKEMFKLATHYPFLTHVVLTLTLMHERHQTGTTTIGERATMHWLQGTALFKEALIKPETQSHRDALWASAAMLGCIQFACIEARTPLEAWPLKAPSSEDLDWMKMSDGKKAVWKIANTANPESVFHEMKGHPDLYRPINFSISDLSNITVEFCEVFGIGPSSGSDLNPYHDAAVTLARLLPVDCDSNTILEFLGFLARLHPKLKNLIEQKDPKALLLVACWYAKIYKYQWWIYRRGLLEGTAICIYLDRYYSHAKTIQHLLRFPKLAFGMAFAADHVPLESRSIPAMPQVLEVGG